MRTIQDCIGRDSNWLGGGKGTVAIAFTAVGKTAADAYICNMYDRGAAEPHLYGSLAQLAEQVAVKC